MIETASGTVVGIYDKDVKTKFGMKKVYDVKLDNGEFYKNGFKAPLVSLGDVVTVEYESGKYGKDIKALHTSALTGNTYTVANNPVSKKETVSVARYPTNQKVFPVPNDHGDRSIIRQNSLTNARELLCHVYNDIPIKNDDTINAIVNKIIEVAYKFEEYSSGDREVKAADEIINKNKTKKTAKKTASEEELVDNE